VGVAVVQEVAGRAGDLAHQLHQSPWIHGRGRLEVKPRTASLDPKQRVQHRRLVAWPCLEACRIQLFRKDKQKITV